MTGGKSNEPNASPLQNPGVRKLDKIVLYGVAHDAYACLRSLNIYNTIAENADLINEKHAGQTFLGAVQQMAMAEVFLSLARIFERPKRNELRSIPFALEFIERNAHSLPVHNRAAMTEVRPSFEQLPKEHARFNGALVSTLREEIARLPAMAALQTLRDKMLAHSDLNDRPETTGISSAQIDELVAFALNFVTIIGEGYVGTTVTSMTGPHFVVEGARTSAFSMSRLLEMAGVTLKPAWIRHEKELKASPPGQ